MHDENDEKNQIKLLQHVHEKSLGQWIFGKE